MTLRVSVVLWSVFRGGGGCVEPRIERLEGFSLTNLPGACGEWVRATCLSTKPLRLPVEEAGESWRGEPLGELVECDETQSGWLGRPGVGVSSVSSMRDVMSLVGRAASETSCLSGICRSRSCERTRRCCSDAWWTCSMEGL